MAQVVFRSSVTVDGHGRVVIPAEVRRTLGVQPGDRLVVRMIDGEIRIMTRGEAIRRAQELVRKYIPAGRRLSDELIQERRTEAARE